LYNDFIFKPEAHYQTRSDNRFEVILNANNVYNLH